MEDVLAHDVLDVPRVLRADSRRLDDEVLVEAHDRLPISMALTTGGISPSTRVPKASTSASSNSSSTAMSSHCTNTTRPLLRVATRTTVPANLPPHFASRTLSPFLIFVLSPIFLSSF